jgi:radical SAM superfamily enzyme YgiQ (UPF0313 family)
MGISRILFLRLGSPYIYKKHNHPRNILPPIMLGHMMSLLEKDYTIEFFDSRLENSTSELMKKSLEFNPDVVIAYFMTYDYQFSLRFLKELKRRIRTKIICVGQHASFAPKSLIYKGSPVDYLLLGESELAIPKFLRELESGAVSKSFEGLYCLENENSTQLLVTDLDKLPIPKHEFFDPERYRSVYPLPIMQRARWGYILATRGCPYNCIFCSPTIRESFGKKFRLRSVKNVVDEMEYLKKIGANVISFLDDCPTISRKFMSDLCDEIIKRRLKIKWICHGRVDQLDKEIMKKMKNAGCCLVKVGVESGSNRIVVDIIKKTFQKVDWVSITKNFFKEAKEVGLPVLAMLILGSPTETRKEIKETIELIKEIDPEMLQIAYFTPYPGSPFYFEYFGKKMPKFDERFYHYNPEFINLSELSDEELKQYQKKIYKLFYLRIGFILKHLRKYFIFYILNPYYIKNLFSIF